MTDAENNATLDDEVSEEQKIVLSWHRDLQDQPGRRAELRRVKELEEVYFAPGFHDLRLRLKGSKWGRHERIALIAAVVARVKHHAPAVVQGRRAGAAAQMAQPRKGSSNARVSDLRFRRLLKTREPDQLLHAIPRIIALLDGIVDVADVAKQLYLWDYSSTRRRWALEYYENLPASSRAQ